MGRDTLTPREVATLVAVGRRLDNAEIAAEFSVSVRTVESHIAALRRKLQVGSRAGLIDAANDLSRRAVELPQNSFVGRDDDVRALQSLLAAHRWVSVVGVAGCGKTRVALTVAASGARVPVVVDLQDVADLDVLPAIARAVGPGPESRGRLLDACAVALQARPHLLVIDNCDRVTEAVVATVGPLLARATSLAVLTTCRWAVGGTAEAVYELAPLPVGGPEAAAVRLFTDRLAVVRPGEVLNRADLGLLTRICRRLDGLPLAIELAAARTRHLSLEELAAHLTAGLGMLERAGPPTRHRSLEAALAWTWDLLDDDERLGLTRLAALPGPFDLALAGAAISPNGERTVLHLLDRSLLSRAAADGDDAPRRFRLLSPVREFILARTPQAVVDDVRRAHSDHVAGAAAELAARARTDDSRSAIERARRLRGDVVAALDWLLLRDPPTALRLARDLAVLTQQYGADAVVLDRLQRVAGDRRACADADPAALADLGVPLCFGDLGVVARLARDGLARAHDDTSRMHACYLAGLVDAYQGHGTATAHLDEAARLAEKPADPWALAKIWVAKGIALRHGEPDDPQAALRAFQAAAEAFADAGDALHVNNVRYQMARAALATDRREAAATWAGQCAAYARDHGHLHELAHAELVSATVGGSHAEGVLAAAVETFRSLGDLRCLTRAHLLRAARRPPGHRAEELRLALDVAVRADDADHQATALEQLVAEYWESGRPRDATLAVGALSALVGPDAAARRCPDDLSRQLPAWDAFVVEGAARWRAQRSPT